LIPVIEELIVVIEELIVFILVFAVVEAVCRDDTSEIKEVISF